MLDIRFRIRSVESATIAITERAGFTPSGLRRRLRQQTAPGGERVFTDLSGQPFKVTGIAPGHTRVGGCTLASTSGQNLTL